MDKKKEGILGLLSQCHTDYEWFWEARQTVEVIKLNWSHAVEMIDKNPGYIFNGEGGIYYSWIKEYYPELFEVIKTKIKDGRWAITGGTWQTGPVTVWCSGESSVRQIFYAHKFFQSEFGTAPAVYWTPDQLTGVSYGLPQIIKKSGMKGIVAALNHWPEGIKKENGIRYFKWQGVDGSNILGYIGAWSTGWNPTEASITNPLNSAYELGIKKALVVIGRENCPPVDSDTEEEFLVGKRNDVPQFFTDVTPADPSQGDLDWWQDAMNNPNNPLIIYLNMNNSFNIFTREDIDRLPIFNNEWYQPVPEGTGSMTSHGETKWYNRQCEKYAEQSEKFSAIAYVMGLIQHYPVREIKGGWLRTLQNQFHGSYTAAGIKETYEGSWWNRAETALNLFKGAMDFCLTNLANNIDTSCKGIPVIIFNPLSFDREEVAEVELVLEHPENDLIVYDSNRNEIPSQVIYKGNKTVRLLIQTSIPQLGYRVYWVNTAENQLTYTIDVEKVQNNCYENDRYLVEINQSTGNISRIFDRENNRELLEDGEIELQIYNDTSNWGNMCDVTIPADHIINDNPHIEVIQSGALRTAIRITKEYLSSTFTQTILLDKMGDRIDIAADIDWHEDSKLLKIAFPLSVSNTEASYEIQYGVIKRPINIPHDVSGDKWADITDKYAEYGVSVISNCKYGWDTMQKNNLLRLSLLRSDHNGDWKGKRDPDSDMGTHKFGYSICGHKGSWQDGNIPRQAWSFNYPLIPIQTTCHEGTLPKANSFVNINSPNVLITVLKKAEDGSECFIVRVYETHGKPHTAASIDFSSIIIHAVEVNLMEYEIVPASWNGNILNITLGMYEIKTFKIGLHRSINKERISFIQVKLEYNQNGASFNHNFADVDIDGDGNSLAAEELHENIVTYGMDFKTAFNNDKKKDVVQCCCQNIRLPQGDYNYLAFLAFAVNGRKKGKFTIRYSDGTIRDFEIDVGDWIGKVGGWNQPVTEDTIAFLMNHRHTKNGDDIERQTMMYLYGIPLEKGKNAESIVLPQEKDIKVIAMISVENMPEYAWIRKSVEIKSLK